MNTENFVYIKYDLLEKETKASLKQAEISTY